ncbi:MAG: hypothetical protein HYV27_16310 [Candidatus Hydrogenedentes bacterium]|nr:hypothetical protein [Candidatus Hydrogenedentota bacterium]
MRAQTRHPLVVPGVLAASFVVGVCWSFWTGPPAVGGAIFAGLPVAVLIRAVYRSRKK